MADFLRRVRQRAASNDGGGSNMYSLRVSRPSSQRSRTIVLGPGAEYPGARLHSSMRLSGGTRYDRNRQTKPELRGGSFRLPRLGGRQLEPPRAEALRARL